MTLAFFTENWPRACALLPEYFPNAGALHCPSNAAELTALIAHLAAAHELTHAETAEMLDDLALGLWAQGAQVSEVTHKMLASS